MRGGQKSAAAVRQNRTSPDFDKKGEKKSCRIRGNYVTLQHAKHKSQSSHTNRYMKDTIIEACSEALHQIHTRQFWKEFIIMTLGMLIAAIAVDYFLVPAKLVIGSTSGIAIVVAELMEAIGLPTRVSICLTVINSFLLLVSFIFLGRDFGAKTVYASLIIGPMVEFCEWILPYAQLIEPGNTSIMGDPWLDSLCFVLILGISQSILFSINGSTGGLDIVAKMANKFLHMEMGTAVTIVGFAASATSIAINPLRIVIIGLIATWINGLVVDYFMAGITRRIRLCIVTDTPEPILQYILHDMNRGCSIYSTKGGYTGEEHTELQTYLQKNDLPRLMAFIRKNDLKVFITASNVNVNFLGDKTKEPN